METKKACLVFVTATADQRAAVRSQLETDGLTVCEVRADLEDAIAGQSGSDVLPQGLEACMADAEVCVFLLPDQPEEDGMLAGAAAGADASGKTLVCVVTGARTVYPEIFQDAAESLLRDGSSSLSEAVSGGSVWEGADKSRVTKRKMTHVKCQ